MKKLLTIIFFLFMCHLARGQSATFLDTCNLISGVPSVANDSTRIFYISGTYQTIYLTVLDSGATYTDSIKAYNITKRCPGKISGQCTDSVVTQITLRRVDAGNYTDYGATSASGTTARYLLVDGFIDHLLLVWSKTQFIAGIRTKVTVIGINRR
jgi:hypothetical protein